jgi:hypothetical protein
VTRSVKPKEGGVKILEAGRSGDESGGGGGGTAYRNLRALQEQMDRR